jgi:ubiquinone/menaquinone biosynthesis C-methylase UbiE
MGEFKDHFSDVAGKYAEFRPAYPRGLFEWIAGVAPRRERAWDCATGNGQAAVALGDFFGEVVATDASAEQVANGIQHERIRYAVAPAENSGLADFSVDVITVAQAAHWFDLPKFYAEAKRVLRPDGALILWCYGTFQFGHAEIDRLLDEYYSHVVGPYWPPERRYIKRDYRTLQFPLNEFNAPRFDMEAEFTRERLAGYLRTWSATQRFMKAKGIDPVTELDSRLDSFWPAGERLRVKSWPISIRAGRFASEKPAGSELQAGGKFLKRLARRRADGGDLPGDGGVEL